MLEFGVLGMNARNLLYIQKFNPNKKIKLVNDKYKTKKLLENRWIPVPNTYFLISSYDQIANINFDKISRGEFVIKPNKWSQWNWITIVQDFRVSNPDSNILNKKKLKYSFFHDILEQYLNISKRDGLGNAYSYVSSIFYKIQSLGQKNLSDKYPDLFKYEYRVWKKRLDWFSLYTKFYNILQWEYNAKRTKDKILIEEKMNPWKVFDEFCKYGLADIRVILFNLVPILAMIRIPTEMSGGKANLAQWWIACGLDLITGRIISLTMWKSGETYTKDFPEEYKSRQGLKIPFWNEILHFSANAQYFINIGYIGIDRVITTTGPKVLEVNGRAGMEIQNISQTWLRNIMYKIEDLDIDNPEKWIEICKALFTKTKTADLENKTVYLSQSGVIKIGSGKDQQEFDAIVNIDTTKKKNYIWPDFLSEIGGIKEFGLEIEDSDIYENIKVYKNPGITNNTIFLGTDLLSKYTIKAQYKTHTKFKMFNTILEDEVHSLQILDQKLRDISRQVLVNKCLVPTNFRSEFDSFVSHKWNYNPRFEYKYPKYRHLNLMMDDLEWLWEKYFQKNKLESKFARIFEDKIFENIDKINLIRAYKKQDIENIHKYNRKFFGDFDMTLVWECENIYRASKDRSMKDFWPRLKIAQMQQIIYEHLDNLGLKIPVKIKQTINSRISVWYKWNQAFINLSGTNRNFFRQNEFVSKLHHEIDWHLVRFLNGQKTWWYILQSGTSHYKIDEEWIAIYLADLFIWQIISNFEKVNIYKKYHHNFKASQMNFVNLWKYMFDIDWDIEFGKNGYLKLFYKILRHKRWLQDTSIIWAGTSYAKEKIYLDGYLRVKKYISDGGDLELLKKYWKVKIEDMQFLGF